MNFTIVIVTYNRISLLKECLRNAYSQTYSAKHVVVVNNKSTDGTTEYLKDLKEESLIIVNEESNLGGAGGFYEALKNVPEDSDYVVIIDDDAILDKGFIEAVVNNMEEDVKAYSGTIYTDGKIDTSHRRRIKNHVLMTKTDVPLEEYEKDSFFYDLSTFCGLVVDYKIIREMGLPKKEYFIWYDDTEYSLRLRGKTRIKNVNAAHINHKTVVSPQSDLSWKSYYGYRNQIDVGRIYSTMPRMYIAYRYTFHIIRIIQIILKKLMNKDQRDYLNNCIKLHKTVLHDAKKKILGKSDVYYPGVKI